MKFTFDETKLVFNPRTTPTALAAAVLAVIALTVFALTARTPLVMMGVSFGVFMGIAAAAFGWLAWSSRHTERVDASGVRVAAHGYQRAERIDAEKIRGVYRRMQPRSYIVEFSLADGRNVQLRNTEIETSVGLASEAVDELVDYAADLLGVPVLPPTSAPYSRSAVMAMQD